MSLFFRQFRILLWKNYLLKKRHYHLTFFEVFIPLITSVMMVITVSSFDPKKPLRPMDRSLNITKRYDENAIFYKQPVYDLSKNVNELFVDGLGLHFLVVPANPCTGRFVDKFDKELRRFVHKSKPPINYSRLKKPDEIETKFSDLKDNRTLIIGIIFHNHCDNDYKKFLTNFLVTIRTLGPEAINFKRLFPDKQSAGPSNENYYLGKNQRGFIAVQNFINLAYLASIKQEQTTKKSFTISNLIVYKYPFLNYMDRPPVTVIDIIPSVVVYTFVVFFPLIVKQIATENHNRVRDMFKLMGLTDFAYFSSTFLVYFIEFFLQAVLITFLYTFKFTQHTPAVFDSTSPLLILVVLLVFGMNLILIGIFFSIFFKNPNIAVISAIVMYLLFDILQYFIDPKYNKAIIVDSSTIKTFQIISCALPVPSIKFSIRIFNFLEWYSTGASFANLFETTYQYGYLSIGLILIMNFCSILLNVILIHYFNNVWPFQYGLVKSWYYPINPILSLFKSEKSAGQMTMNETTKTETTVDVKYFEEEETKAKVTVSIQNLCKKYGKKTVISNINLDLHENQLTALLGHNSAGKTTLMNMITGLTPATTGLVLINGIDLKKDAKKARKSIGLCPQHNILYDELTAYEHLMIYGTVKGKSSKEELEQEIDELLKKLYLESKRDVISSSYSGGMKRKLNLAIALIGKSEIVILDEPTAGIDSESRRMVWDVLLKEKRNRTILLTTHFIEESDVLGDRIFIISKGKARCHGSPIFLKNIFGMGYQLRIAKDLKFNTTEGARNKLSDFIRNYFRNSTILDENVGEIIYSLDKNESSSKEETGTSVFTLFFTEFEKIRADLNISTFGITLITLEDVFLKILYLSNESEPEVEKKISLGEILKSDRVVTFFEDRQQLNRIKNRFKLFGQRFKALVIKRLHHLKRYYPSLVFQLIIPVAIFWLILYLDLYLKPNAEERKSLVLDERLYGETSGFFKDNTNDSDLFRSYNKTARKRSMKVIQLDWTTEPDVFIANKSNKQTLSTYIKTELFGCVVNKLTNSTKANLNLDLEIWYNNEATHSLPLSISAVYGALFDYLNDGRVEQYGKVSIINEPFQNPMAVLGSYRIIKGLKVMWSLLSSLSLPFLAASYSLFPIQEYVSKSKLLQKISGSTGWLYWSSTFIIDLISHTIACLFMLAIFFWQDKKHIFIGFKQSTDALFVLFFLFGLSSMQISYTLSRIFKSISAGFFTIVVSNLIFGSILVIFEFFFDYLGHSQNLSKDTLNIIHWLFRLFPIYSVAKGISNLYEIGSKAQLCDHLTGIQQICDTNPLIQSCCSNCTENCFLYKNPFVWDSNDGILMEVVALLIIFAFALLLNLALEDDLITRLIAFVIAKFKCSRIVIIKRTGLDYQLTSEDADVIQEKERVQILVQKTKKKKGMLVHHLTKVFNRLVAVDDLSFALNQRECFGLLGVNGAGKTTTFRMLVGDLSVTEGTAYIDNLNLRDNLRAFQKNIGYCPQFDALLDNLTGEETLYLFGRLRGIKENNLKRTVDYIIKMVDLQKHANSVCSNYSGGNKRKLSLGIALIGLPKIIFLDEPTAGVDAEARRKIWKTLVSVKEKFNCSIVLTSHSMDECEALCSRVAIMVAGKFKCINSVQNLRQKYGKGYTLTIKLKAECLEQQMYLSKLKEKIKQVFPSANCKDFHETLLNYQIEDNELKWSFLFQKLDQLREEFNLEYYLLSDTTLESIFINFAKTQKTSS